MDFVNFVNDFIATILSNYAIRQLTFFVACFCTVSACLLSILHIMNFSKNSPHEIINKMAIRIFFMVPIYSVISLYSLSFGDRYENINELLTVFLEAYEPIVMYSFMMLFITCMNGDLELVRFLRHCYIPGHKRPCNCKLPRHHWSLKLLCCLAPSKWDNGEKFYVACMLGPSFFIFYSLINVPVRFLSWCLASFVGWHNFSNVIFVISDIFRNFFQMWALYCLLMLYSAVCAPRDYKDYPEEPVIFDEDFLIEQKRVTGLLHDGESDKDDSEDNINSSGVDSIYFKKDTERSRIIEIMDLDLVAEEGGDIDSFHSSNLNRRNMNPKYAPEDESQDSFSLSIFSPVRQNESGMFNFKPETDKLEEENAKVISSNISNYSQMQQQSQPYIIPHQQSDSYISNEAETERNRKENTSQKELRAISDAWMAERKQRLEMSWQVWLLRFLCVKGLVFFTFWQTVCLRAMQAVGMINVEAWGISESWTNDQVREATNFLLICVEMLLFAVAHFFVFDPKDINQGLQLEIMVSSVMRGLDENDNNNNNNINSGKKSRSTFDGHSYTHIPSQSVIPSAPDSMSANNVMFGSILTSKGKIGKRKIPHDLPKSQEELNLIVENQALNLYERLRALKQNPNNSNQDLQETHLKTRTVRELATELSFEVVVLTQPEALEDLDEVEINARLYVVMNRLVSIRFQRELANNLIAERLRNSAGLDDIVDFGLRAVKDWDYDALERDILEEEKHQNEQLASKLLNEKKAQFDKLMQEMKEEYKFIHARPRLPPNAHTINIKGALNSHHDDKGLRHSISTSSPLNRPLLQQHFSATAGVTASPGLRSSQPQAPPPPKPGSGVRASISELNRLAMKHHRHSSMVHRSMPMEYGTFRLVVPTTSQQQKISQQQHKQNTINAKDKEKASQ